VASDYIALGVLSAAEAHGIDVTGDLSTVGFGDIRFAQYVRPRLTTIRSPSLLGYNRLTGKSATQVLVRCAADPLLVVGSHGAGRSAAFASDCVPHWCPPPFMAWPGPATTPSGATCSPGCPASDAPRRTDRPTSAPFKILAERSVVHPARSRIVFTLTA
jgi:hypothetical protein